MKGTPDKELASRLHWMDDRSFCMFVNTLPDSMFTSLSREDAVPYQQLQRQITPESDGYPTRSLERPMTWSLNYLIDHELQYLEAQLNSLGVDEIRVGTEIEFALSEETVLSNNKWLQVKATIIDGLGEDIRSTEGVEKVAIQEKRAAIEKFNAREILMYDLVEIDEETRDILEPIFGTSKDGNGYYDAEGTLELKLNPVSPQQQIQNRQTILEAIYRKATDYGLIMEDLPPYHVSFSFWYDRENLLDPESSEFLTKGKAVIEGATRAVYDALPILIPPHTMNENLSTDVKFTVDRDNFLRFSKGRMELRPMVDGDYQDTEAYLPIIIAVAVHGLKEESREHFLSATEVTKAQFHHEPDQYKTTAHILGNSIIGEDDRLIILQ